MWRTPSRIWRVLHLEQVRQGKRLLHFLLSGIDMCRSAMHAFQPPA